MPGGPCGPPHPPVDVKESSMPPTRLGLALACAAAIALTARACTRNKTARMKTTTGSRTYSSPEPYYTGSEVSGDTAFLQAAAMDGWGEIELSNLALRQSSRMDVRELAQQMINDHTLANNRILELARARNII